jgi:uncharacterized membrane protein YhaH (DUF805 family)
MHYHLTQPFAIVQPKLKKLQPFVSERSPAIVCGRLNVGGKGGAVDFKKFYLSPDGRINRKQFWLWLVLPLSVIEILLALVDVKTGNYNSELSVGLFSGIFALVTLIPIIIVYIKRFHDRDKSGWWVLIALIPVIGAIWMLIELGFLKGTPGPNQFGPPVTD